MSIEIYMVLILWSLQSIFYKIVNEYLEGGINAECGTAQDYLLRCSNECIVYAITFSASIELLHPSFNLFEEIYRITKKGFIFAINENKHTYPLFFR